MKTYRTLIFILILCAAGFAQQTDTTRDFTNYRRTDPNNLPAPEKYQQPKEQVYPLGYGTNHLGKITTGTGTWTELNPGVPRVDYVGIDFINPDTGWACGGSGAIIKTINGGTDWTISETPINNLLLKISSYNRQVVIATGYDGIILRSSDGGETFEQVISGVGSGIDLWGLKIINDTLGWACGLNQTLLKTTDAGSTWQPVSTGLNQHYWSLDFLNEQFGLIACGNGIVLRTTDGGTSWSQIQAGDTRALYTINIIDSLHIAVGGEAGKNCYSSDGGLTWTQNNNLIFSEVNCIAFVDADTGYTIGELWGIKKTTNRGVSWFSEGNNICEWWLKLLPGGTGFSVGDELKIYKTEGGYDNWVNIFFNIDLADVYFTDEMTGYIAGGTWVGGPVYKTTDGGQSWFGLPNFPIGLFTSTLTTLIFTDSVTGFASGTNTTVKTTDAGESWYEPNGLPGGIGRFFFLNKDIGWGTSGKNILKTIDGGENWITQFTVPNGSFSSINFVDSLYGWASILGRRPYKTTDGGTSWIEQTNLNFYATNDVYFPNYDLGFTTNDNAGYNLYKTLDSGSNWTIVNGVITPRRFGFFPDTNRWWTFGFSNLYETIDGGENWTDITPSIPMFTKFNAPFNWLGYGVGGIGYIVKYIDSSYVPVELISFTASIKDNNVLLQWVTASELNNYGFEIEKSLDEIYWERIGFVAGKGTATEKSFYHFSEELYKPVQFYRLKQVDYDGSFSYSGTIKVESMTELIEYVLYQNFPNPFNSITIIKFYLPKKEFVNLSFFNITGEKIYELMNEALEEGLHSLNFNAKDLPSGVYFYGLTTSGGYREIRKLTLIK